MAQTVTIGSKIPLSAPEVPAYDHRSGAAANRAYGAVQGFAQNLQSLTDEARKQQDALDFTKLSGNYEIGLDKLKDELTAEPDYPKRLELFNQRALELQSQTLDRTQHKTVQQALNIHIGRIMPEKFLAYKRDVNKEWGSARLGQLDQIEDVLAERIVNSTDAEESTRLRNSHRGLVAGLTQGPGAPLNPAAAEKRAQDFTGKTLERLATKIIRSNPDAMFNSEVVGQLAPLGEARILELQSKARKVGEEEDNRTERGTKKNKALVLDAADAQANFGKLDGDWLNNALAGNNPLVRPSEARKLKEINDSPPTGAGNSQADVIWDQYLSGPRTLDRINKARQELNHLSKDVGSNKTIRGYKNELQSDQTTIENQGISRENNQIQRDNRAIDNLKTSYDAWVETNPFLKTALGNMAPRDKARLEDTYRKEGAQAAEKLRDELIKGKTDKLNNLPDIKAMQKALNY